MEYIIIEDIIIVVQIVRFDNDVDTCQLLYSVF